MKSAILRPLVTILVVIAALWGCTQNDGRIGVWFGTWTLTSITVDGEAGTDYHDNSTWSFQNSVILIQEEGAHNQYSDHYGSWSEEAEILTLDFTHHDTKDTLSWSTLYKLPQNMYFGMRQGKVRLHIDHLSGSKADLTCVNPDNQTVTYHLKKLY